mgnify:CR=1 FL=1
MQIFLLSLHPRKNAEYHCDKHVNKMCTETTQILSWVYYNAEGILQLSDKQLRAYKKWARPQGFYKFDKGHFNHPCSIWARKRLQNFQWLLRLGLHFCQEFEFRYKHKHACEDIINWMWQNSPDIPFKQGGKLSRFPGVFREPYDIQVKAEFPEINNNRQMVKAYRYYYTIKTAHFAKYEKTRKAPKWL